MAVAQMSKFIVASHRSEASEVLEALQHQGICHLLEAEKATVTRDAPDLIPENKKPKDIEKLLSRLEKSISFLSGFSEIAGGLGAALAPRTVIDEETYKQVISDKDMHAIIDQAEETESAIEELESKRDHLWVTLEHLKHWANLDTPVEEIGPTEKATAAAGFVPLQNFEQLKQVIGDLGAAIQVVEQTTNKNACIIVALNENVSDVHKSLRQADFEQIHFEAMKGKVKDLISEYTEKIQTARNELQEKREKAKSLAENLLNLQILYDHYSNLFSREHTRTVAPSTEQTVLLEGWVKKEDYKRLEKSLSEFKASSLQKLEAVEDEDIPVEIENKNVIKPFEVITRLYGMPQYLEVDPTAFLAPFFALFFALCLTDAGYGIIIIAAMAYFIRKMQGDKKLMWMLGICSVITIVAGALTGGWFGDAVQKFIPALGPVREKMMWFDPFEKPMIFFILSLAIGYIHLLTGLVIAFVYNLKRRKFIDAVFDQLTWLVMLNSILIFGAGKSGMVPAPIGSLFGYIALIPAGAIFLFSQREGGWAGRLGMGAYNLFSTIFYLGDVLSYLRLMALGMVTAGLAMAINVIAQITRDIPYIGLVVMIFVLIGGHLFNLAISALSAFVHTLRLQYVEFFPKFFTGGGLPFEPLDKKYKHVYIKNDQNENKER
ncbi:MAG: V-type ATP synthase subunit I [Planctomycetota bacterium]|jgi:V/A-type H+-transporting ATPase subunit I